MNRDNKTDVNGKIAIVIPSYKEKNNLKKIIPLMFSLFPSSHLVIVDDNSPDKTKNEILNLQKNIKIYIWSCGRKKMAGVQLLSKA